jgi:hypothetical protein
MTDQYSVGFWQRGALLRVDMFVGETPEAVYTAARRKGRELNYDPKLTRLTVKKPGTEKILLDKFMSGKKPPVPSARLASRPRQR